MHTIFVKMKIQENVAKDIFQADNPENHTGYLIWQVSNIRQRIINNKLKELEFTYPQFVISMGIKWLTRSNEIVNQVTLINFTKMDKSVVSSVLKSLEKRNIVIREVDPNDTRAKKLELSELGKSILEKALYKINKIDELFFDDNSFDINSLNSVLTRLISKNET